MFLPKMFYKISN